VLNIAVAVIIITLARTEAIDIDIIFYVGAFLLVIMVFKISFSILFFFKSKFDRLMVYRLKRKRNSTVFDDKSMFKEITKNDVFQVYYDHDGKVKRASTVEDLAHQTSVKSKNTFRGFDLKKLTEHHKIQQGVLGNLLGRQGTQHYYEEQEEIDKEEEKLLDSDSEEGSLLNSPDPAMRQQISKLFRNTATSRGNKEKFDDAYDDIDKILQRKARESVNRMSQNQVSAIRDTQKLRVSELPEKHHSQEVQSETDHLDEDGKSEGMLSNSCI